MRSTNLLLLLLLLLLSRYQQWRWQLFTEWPKNHLFCFSAINIHPVEFRPLNQSASCIFDTVSFIIISDIVVSSRYMCISHFNRKSSMRMMKINGPNHEPWGIPPRSMTQSENISEIFTRCWRSQRNELNAQWIHRTMKSGTPSDLCFLNHDAVVDMM